MEATRPLFIPVILGTTRQGRMSLHASRLVTQELAKHPGVESELIDIATLPLPTNNAGEAIKDPGFSTKMDRADALVIVAPEYNHGYSGLLKHVLDSCLKEYIHKAVGIVGVSAGPFGGARVIENLLPVMRELGLVTIFWDVNFSSVRNFRCEWSAARPVLHSTDRQVPERAYLDGQNAALWTRAGGVAVDPCRLEDFSWAHQR